MNWVRAIAAVLVLWSSTAWGATLSWTANSEPDMVGYHVYHCSLTPCTKSSVNASLLVTLGTGTSFNIGTPAVTQYYFITAYDFANNESGSSNLATFTPAGSPPSVGTVELTVVGNPATGPWGVTATTTNTQDVMARVRLDGFPHHTDSLARYSFPGDNGSTVNKGLFGTGTHTVEFVFYLQNTTSEIGRASVTVQEGSPAPPPSAGTVSLKIVGSPATGPWGVNATTTDPRDVMATVRLDGAVHHVEHNAPYGFPNDNGTTATTGLFGTGPHTVEFVFYLEGTTSEIGRACVAVQEGSPTMGTVGLTVVGNPATGPWGVNATTTDPRDVMTRVRLDGVPHHPDNAAPYGFPDYDRTTTMMGRFGTGTHTVEFVFYLQNTTSEIGRACVNVKEGTQ